MDESSEPGFEEIISDEEIDFPEYDYREWEENWAHKFSRPFNPFSDSFEVLPLKVCPLYIFRNLCVMFTLVYHVRTHYF